MLTSPKKTEISIWCFSSDHVVCAVQYSAGNRDFVETCTICRSRYTSVYWSHVLAHQVYIWFDLFLESKSKSYHFPKRRKAIVRALRERNLPEPSQIHSCLGLTWSNTLALFYKDSHLERCPLSPVPSPWRILSTSPGDGDGLMSIRSRAWRC